MPTEPLTAVHGINSIADRMASTGLVSKQGEVTSMAMGAEFALHELEMWLLATRKRTISVGAVCLKIREIRQGVRGLSPAAGSK